MVKQSTTKAKAKKKKKKPALPTIKMKLLGSIPGSTAENRVSLAEGGLLTDGVRWAAYEPQLGVTQLVDTVQKKTINRPDPEGCANGLIALGGGELLYSCENPECPPHENNCRVPPAASYETARYIIEDITSGALHALAGDNHLPDDSPEGGKGVLDGIGSQWAQGVVGAHRGGAIFFVNWHTGRLVYQTEEPSTASEEVENLNSTQLTQRLCKPLTRPPTKIEEVAIDLYAPFAYEYPFAVIGPQEIIGQESEISFQLRRCGSNKRMILPSAANGTVQLGARLLSWLGTSKYITRLLTNGRTWHDPLYRLTGLPSNAGENDTVLQHTSTMVFATVSPGSGPAQVYSASLPWAHSASARSRRVSK